MRLTWLGRQPVKSAVRRRFRRRREARRCFGGLLLLGSRPAYLPARRFQRLHHFPELESVPETVINHLRQCLQMNQAVEVRYDRPNTMYRHRQLIRDWLEVQPYHDNIKV
jgi:hypothetical protein